MGGAEAESVVQSFSAVLGLKGKWKAPEEYLRENVSDIVIRIILGFYIFDN